MTITYKVGNALYLNITNRCTNSCAFCIRNNGDGAYGSDSLWLEHEPTIKEIKDDIFSHNLNDYDEIVFCGYGEPLIRFDAVIEVARSIKEKYTDKIIRINTNGQGELINYDGIAKYFKGVVDKISVSLNASNSKDYQQICDCIYGERAYDAIIKFAKSCVPYVPEVVMSIVDVIPEDEIEQCRKITEEIGVKLRVRHKI